MRHNCYRLPKGQIQHMRVIYQQRDPSSLQTFTNTAHCSYWHTYCFVCFLQYRLLSLFDKKFTFTCYNGVQIYGSTASFLLVMLIYKKKILARVLILALNIHIIVKVKTPLVSDETLQHFCQSKEGPFHRRLFNFCTSVRTYICTYVPLHLLRLPVRTS